MIKLIATILIIVFYCATYAILSIVKKLDETQFEKNFRLIITLIINVIAIFLLYKLWI